jgi:hypothetical protein
VIIITVPIIHHLVARVHVIDVAFALDGQIGVSGDSSGFQVLKHILGHLEVAKQGGSAL